MGLPCGAATGASPAGEAASAGVVSPTVLPETEGQVSERACGVRPIPAPAFRTAKRPKAFLLFIAS